MGLTSLTSAQTALLERAARDTFKDDSGAGVVILDGRELRVAERLGKMGLGTMSMVCGGRPFGALKITPAGRRVLAVPSTDRGAPDGKA